MEIIIKLNGLHFHAPLGWYEEEQLLGNEIKVDIEIKTDVEEVEADELSHTINYEIVYDKVKTIIMVPTKLLETAANSIAKDILSGFAKANEVKVKVTKLNPPIVGKVESVAVEVVKRK